MSIGIADVLDKVASHAQATAYFPTVLKYEPKAAPAAGTVCVFVSEIRPYAAQSGLASVSVILTVVVRIYANMLQEPQDDIDRDVIIAGDTLIAAYVGDFQLGNADRVIDIFARQSDGLTGKTGYINHDSKMFRVLDITIPIIINDVWTEAA